MTDPAASECIKLLTAMPAALATATAAYFNCYNPGMQKWEYLTASFNSNDAYSPSSKLYQVPSGQAIGSNWNEALNSLGELGWELVCTGADQLIFKRAKE